MKPYHSQSVSQSGETRSNGIIMKRALRRVVSKQRRLKQTHVLSIFHCVQYWPPQSHEQRAKEDLLLKPTRPTTALFIPFDRGTAEKVAGGKEVWLQCVDATLLRT